MYRRDTLPSDWDPARDEYQASHAVERDNSRVKDHSRLYIKDFPRDLTEEGIRSAFGRFGTLVEVFVSKDPTKKYALIGFESPGEAKLAMAKMNNTEPLNLNITVAYRKKVPVQSEGKHAPRYTNTKEKYSGPSEVASVASSHSTSRNNGLDLTKEDDLDITEYNETEDLELKLEELELLKAELVYKHKLRSAKLAQQRAAATRMNSRRSMLPDGRIMVSNYDSRTVDNSDKQRDAVDGSLGGAGDSWVSIPGLQGQACRQCVNCGGSASKYCSRCGVTPYCGGDCQKKDWMKRHRGICHSLVHEPQPMPPLRRPRSPNTNRDDNPRKNMNQESRYNNTNSNPRNDRGSNNLKDSKPNGFRRPSDRLIVKNDEEETVSNNRFEAPKPAPPKEVRKPQPKPVEAEPAPKIETPMENKYAPSAPPAEAEEKEVKIEKVEKPLVPAKCLVDELKVGSTVLLSVDNPTSTCKESRPGFVCLSLNEQYQEKYALLCEDYLVDCVKNGVECKPSIGESFSLFISEDEAWYRARLLNASEAALIDASKVVKIEGAKCVKLAQKYADLVEFTCYLKGDGVKVGNQLLATVVSRSPLGLHVTLTNAENQAELGSAVLDRWKPKVEYPKEKTEKAAPAAIPTVCRPDIESKIEMVLVDATEKDKIFLRKADIESRKKFDSIEQDVAMYGLDAPALKEPPTSGELVVALFTDGLFYRALVRRTNVKLNKYLLEYIEYGNEEVSTLEKLRPCPDKFSLKNRPCLTSKAKLHQLTDSFTKPANEYLNEIKDSSTVVVTFPDNALSSPSGSEVILKLSKNNENINTKLSQMCKPDWKKIEEKGQDVIASKVLMLDDAQSLNLPPKGGSFHILDSSMLQVGMLSVCTASDEVAKHMEYVLGTVTEKINAYCNSEVGKEPYLPRDGELCIAQFPPYDQWYRAAKCESKDGPGSSEASILYLDYGNMAMVDVKHLRKMLPDFVNDIPMLANAVTIKGFPQELTPQQLAKIKKHLDTCDEGPGGVINLTKCELITAGMYEVEAPEIVNLLKD